MRRSDCGSSRCATDEPTGRAAPYSARCGGGISGSGAALERETGVNTSVGGVGSAGTTARGMLVVAAVHD